MKHQVHIFELISGFHSVVDPGLVFVDSGDTIEFHNDTNYQVKLLFAEGGLLDGIGSMKGKTINKGQARAWTVQPAAPDVYEYVVSVKLKRDKRVFAVGTSTPRIIVKPPPSSSSGG